MLTKFRIHSETSNPTNKLQYGTKIECICDIADIPKLILSGINGEFEYEGIWYDFCNGSYVTLPESSSFYRLIDYALVEIH